MLAYADLLSPASECSTEYRDRADLLALRVEIEALLVVPDVADPVVHTSDTDRGEVTTDLLKRPSIRQLDILKESQRRMERTPPTQADRRRRSESGDQLQGTGRSGAIRGRGNDAWLLSERLPDDVTAHPKPKRVNPYEHRLNTMRRRGVLAAKN